MVTSFKRNQVKGYTDFVTIESRKSTKGNKLRLNFSTDISPKYWNKTQQRISAKMSDTPENRAALDGICNQMYLDYLRDDFDATLTRYLPHLKPLESNLIQFPNAKPEMTIGELWEQYNEYDLAGKKEATVKLRCRQYKKIASFADKTLSQETANEIRKTALEDGGQVFKCALATLERAVDWAVRQEKSQIVKNPFFGMSKEIKVAKRQDRVNGGLPEFVAYTESERDLILETFRNHESKQISRYADFYEFKFLTGCRTGEAIALTWDDVDFEKKRIRFNKTKGDGLKLSKGSKNSSDDIRFFPIYPKLEKLLRRLQSESKCGLVFSNRAGGYLTANRVVLAWSHNGETSYGVAKGKKYYDPKGVVYELTEQGLLPCYLSPYNTRHTFINIAIECGIDTFDIADWCGNSDAVISDVYRSKKRDGGKEAIKLR
ncbi:MAG: site-specific integrase [Chroococcales cyanobacterium]